MKTKFHIPTQSFGFLEIEGTEKDFEKMEKLYNRYAETAINFNGKFKEVTTFTDEVVLYDEENHKYTDQNGGVLMSGSQFAASFEQPFDKEVQVPKTAKKLNVAEKHIDAMWTANGKISRMFGTVIHKAMEHWFRNKVHGTKYNISKHPFLKSVVESFPLKDKEVLPELMVSCVARKMVGQIDGLHITGEKEAEIIDYKTDAEVKKNLKKHFIQMSFYAFILQQFGWKIPKVVVWNYTDGWEKYESEVLDLKKLKK